MEVGDLYDRAHAKLDRCLAGPRWMLWTVAALVVLSFFLHFPPYGFLRDHLNGTAVVPEWTNLLAQRDHPLTPLAHPEGSHLEKTTFRLTIPLLARALHLGVIGITVLGSLLGVWLVWLTLDLAFRTTGDRAMAALFTTTVTMAYAGSAAFFDVWAYGDGFAYAFLVLAFRARRWPVVMIAVLLAAFTDERALIASAVVFLYHRDAAQRSGTWGCALGWAGYFALRTLLAARFGFPTHTGGIGLHTLIAQRDMLPWALWSAFEGGWLLLLPFLFALFRRAPTRPSMLYGGGFLLILLTAFVVIDLTRSLAYGFVLLFPALTYLMRTLEASRLRALLFFAAVVTLLHPMCFTLGGSRVIIVQPILVKVLGWIGA